MAITDPRDISGLVAWYSAEAETGYTDGQAMTSWTDLSGNGNHATPSASAPLWRAAGGASAGPRVEHDTASGGILRYWNLPNIMGSATSGEIMVSILSLNVSCGLWRFGSAGVSSSDGNHYPFSGQVYDTFGLSTGKRQNFTPTLAISSWRRYNVYAANNDWQAFLDGTSQKTYTAGGAVAWSTTPLLGGTIANSTLNGVLKGSMAAAIIYNRKLTTTERADLNTWLAANPSGGTATIPSATGTLSGVLPSLAASLSGDITFSGAISATLPALAADIAGTSVPLGAAGTLDAVLPPLGGSLAGAYSDTGTLAAILPPLSANLAGAYGPTGTLNATLPNLAASLAGTSVDPGVSGVLSATLPALSASLSGHVLGRAGFGLALDSSATVTVDAALDATITSTTVPLHVVTPTVPVPTLVAGRPS